MCGRYVLYGPKSRWRAESIYFEGLDSFPDRYNVAPSQTMPVVRLVEGKPTVTPARWGLIPYWAKDSKIGYSTFNAMAETVAEKPAFREAYKKRRCLVPASGYYEWAKRPHGKQPYYFTSRDGSLLTFAGLWEKWKPKDGEPIVSYTIIVCAPNPLAAGVHDRMPVIIAEKDREHWLSEHRGPHHLRNRQNPARLLKPCPDELLHVFPVSTAVNTPKHDAPELIEPIGKIELSECPQSPSYD